MVSPSRHSSRHHCFGSEPRSNYDSYGNDFVELKSIVNSPKFASENLLTEETRNKAVTFGAEGLAKEELIRRDNEVGLLVNLSARRNLLPQGEVETGRRG